MGLEMLRIAFSVWHDLESDVRDHGPLTQDHQTLSVYVKFVQNYGNETFFALSATNTAYFRKTEGMGGIPLPPMNE